MATGIEEDKEDIVRTWDVSGVFDVAARVIPVRLVFLVSRPSVLQL
jgi:hypothetical protein